MTTLRESFKTNWRGYTFSEKIGMTAFILAIIAALFIIVMMVTAQVWAHLQTLAVIAGIFACCTLVGLFFGPRDPSV